MITALLGGILVWIIASSCFTWLLFSSIETGQVPFWIASGAYASGYLGGYLTLVAPSGIGVSEGLTSLILSQHLPLDQVLAVAIAFRIIQTLVIWVNILVTALLTFRSRKDEN